MLENQITTNFIDLTSSNFVAIFHINYWDQVNSCKNLWKFWNGPLCRNKSATSSLMNVAAYWKSSNIEACAKNLSQILANNTDNERWEIGLRIYVRYCRITLSTTNNHFYSNRRTVSFELAWNYQATKLQKW